MFVKVFSHPGNCSTWRLCLIKATGLVLVSWKYQSWINSDVFFHVCYFFLNWSINSSFIIINNCYLLYVLLLFSPVEWREVWLGTLRLWRFVPSPPAVSSDYFWSTKPWGQREGLPEKWGVKHGCRRIPPTPQWICENVHTCLHMRARCDCSAAAATQGLRGKPCTSHLEHISNKIKFPCLFPSLSAMTHISWRQLVSVRVQSADVLMIPQFTQTCATAHWNGIQLLVTPLLIASNGISSSEICSLG